MQSYRVIFYRAIVHLYLFSSSGYPKILAGNSQRKQWLPLWNGHSASEKHLSPSVSEKHFWRCFLRAVLIPYIFELDYQKDNCII
jgi:hypothetical protein